MSTISHFLLLARRSFPNLDWKALPIVFISVFLGSCAWQAVHPLPTPQKIPDENALANALTSTPPGKTIDPQSGQIDNSPTPPTSTSAPFVPETPTPARRITNTTAPPSVTSTHSATPSPPAGFATRLLRQNVFPQSYLIDPCESLRLRWSPENSPPGTVVVPIMFHGIREAGKPIRADDHVTVSEEFFLGFVRYAKQLGFQTVTTAQLIDFLTRNAPIPPRSMILIVDDRNVGTVENHFLPVLQENHWTVTMGWIIGDTSKGLWERVERLNATGLVDIQSHGYLHRYMTSGTPEEEIRQEIFGPIPVLEEHFGKRPVAFVWPGGNFTPLTVQIAREAGYQLGFTANSNGPLLFNWIPLREDERTVEDPLMVLPRYWSSDANLALDQAVKYAQQASDFAVQNYEAEAAWFRSVCGDELP